MSTATVDEPLVAVPEKTILFMSRRSDLRLVKKAIQPLYGPGGQKTGEQPGETVAFRDGALRVPLEGDALLERGRKTDAVELVAWLRSHPMFGDLKDGFWLVEAVAPPVSEEEMDRLLEMAQNFDEARIVALIEQERAGWDRPGMVGPAEKALERVRKLAALEADAERGGESK